MDDIPFYSGVDLVRLQHQVVPRRYMIHVKSRGRGNHHGVWVGPFDTYGLAQNYGKRLEVDVYFEIHSIYFPVRELT